MIAPLEPTAEMVSKLKLTKFSCSLKQRQTKLRIQLFISWEEIFYAVTKQFLCQTSEIIPAKSAKETITKMESKLLIHWSTSSPSRPSRETIFARDHSRGSLALLSGPKKNKGVFVVYWNTEWHKIISYTKHFCKWVSSRSKSKIWRQIILTQTGGSLLFFSGMVAGAQDTNERENRLPRGDTTARKIRNYSQSRHNVIN